MDTGVLNISDGNKIPTAQDRGIVVFFDHDQSVTGTQAITGVGFKPTSIICFAGENQSPEWTTSMISEAGPSTGFVMSGRHAIIAGQIQTTEGNFIAMNESGSNQSLGTFTSWDADGFTITWAKNVTPTGITRMGFMCFR